MLLLGVGFVGFHVLVPLWPEVSSAGWVDCSSVECDRYGHVVIIQKIFLYIGIGGNIENLMGKVIYTEFGPGVPVPT
jgi:hypothetical protein